MVDDPQPQEPTGEPPAAPPRGAGEVTLIDYYFDLSEADSDGVKTCVTYAYGMEIDRRSDTVAEPKSFTDLMAEALPVIQTDIDTYGIAP